MNEQETCAKLIEINQTLGEIIEDIRIAEDGESWFSYPQVLPMCSDEYLVTLVNNAFKNDYHMREVFANPYNAERDEWLINTDGYTVVAWRHKPSAYKGGVHRVLF